MPNLPTVPVVPAFPFNVPNSQNAEPWEWVSSDKVENMSWRVDEDGLKCVRVTKVTTDIFDQWTCTRWVAYCFLIRLYFVRFKVVKAML